MKQPPLSVSEVVCMRGLEKYRHVQGSAAIRGPQARAQSDWFVHTPLHDSQACPPIIFGFAVPSKDPNGVTGVSV